MGKKKIIKDFAALKNLISKEIKQEKTKQKIPIKNQTTPHKKQCLEITISKKGRAGKVVTVIKNFKGDEADLKKLCKKIQTNCGVGGSVKNGEILIQGKQQKKLKVLLEKIGHQVKCIGG